MRITSLIPPTAARKALFRAPPERAERAGRSGAGGGGFGLRLACYAALAILSFAAAACSGLVHGRLYDGPPKLIRYDARGYLAYQTYFVGGTGASVRTAGVYQRDQPPLPPDADARRAMHFNRYPLGLALATLPGYLAGLPVAWAMGQRPVPGWAGQTLATALGVIACVHLLALLGAALTDRLLADHFRLGGGAAFAAVLTVWVGTAYAFYTAVDPLRAHAAGAAWLAALLWSAHRAAACLDRQTIFRAAGFAAVAGLAFGMMAVTRFTSVLFVAVPAVLLWRTLTRHSPRAAAAVAAGLSAAALPAGLQLLAWERVRQGATKVSLNGVGYHAEEGFYWLRPALLRSLFSSHHGLIFFSPLLLLAVFGLVLAFRKAGPVPWLLAPLCASAAALWYVNSAWYAWHFSGPYGNRGYVELTPLFAVGLGVAYQWAAGGTPLRRRAVVAFSSLAVALNVTFMTMTVLRAFPPNAYWIPQERALDGGPLSRF